jgi:two-component system phosphate regulon sensor histidine kinase PhoR
VSFRAKVFVGTVVAAIVSLVASERLLSWRLQERESAQLVDRLAIDARLIARSLETSSAHATDFDSPAHEWGNLVSGRVTLVAQDGLVLGDSTQTPEERARLDNHANRPEIRQAGSSGFGQSRRHSDTVNRDMVYVAVRSTHPEVRYVRVAMPATEADSELASVRRLALVAFAIGIPVALLVAWLTTAPLGRRLQAVTRLAAAYKAGEPPAAPRDFPPDELGTVAHALDEAARELSRRVADLSQDRARIDAIVAGMVEGVLVVDREGRVQRVNAAARHLLGIGEIVLGQPFPMALKDRTLVDLLTSAVRGDADAAIEMPLQRDPSRTIVARASAVPADRGGGAVLVLHDISDTRRTDRMRQDFVANVSHELRTPLTVIRGYAEALADGVTTPEDAQEFGGVITRHAAKMERLVADLLRLARLDAQQETLSLSDCDVPRIFNDILQGLAPLIESKGHRTTVHVAAGADTVLADAEKLHDLLRNLVDNAVTYAPDGAEIRLEAWPADGGVRLTVADNGPGIPEPELSRIFERFYRVDPSRARPGGTGLGLAIVKHLVELHGGQVSASNGALGGAVFTVVLPSRTQ